MVASNQRSARGPQGTQAPLWSGRSGRARAGLLLLCLWLLPNLLRGLHFGLVPHSFHSHGGALTARCLHHSGAASATGEHGHGAEARHQHPAELSNRTLSAGAGVANESPLEGSQLDRAGNAAATGEESGTPAPSTTEERRPGQEWGPGAALDAGDLCALDWPLLPTSEAATGEGALTCARPAESILAKSLPRLALAEREQRFRLAPKQSPPVG